MSNPDRLLVVDDDAYNRDMLSRRLERRGYEVTVAADGNEALALIEGQTFDLVLLDNMMPGISGLDLLRLLRATYNPTELPVIMVTAQSESENIVQALKAGANDYVVKPVDFPVAAARIQNELARRTTAAALRESEERYALAARGAQDGLWDWDLKRGTVYYSPSWKRMLGFSDQDLTDSPEEWLCRVCEPDRTRLRAEIATHLKSDATEWECDYRVTRCDGEIRWMRSRAVCSRDRTGAALRLTGSQSDITAAAATDALTGLGNRTYVASEIDRTISDPRHRPYAMLILDLDGFKLVNDSLGHHAGDQLLKEIANRLRNVCGRFALEHGDLRIEPARLGGDEFAVLVVGDHRKVPIDLATRFKEDLSGPFDLEGRDVFGGVTIGLVSGNGSYHTSEEVLRDADIAMNRAKRLGPGRVQVFDPAMRASAVARLELETGLRHAIERNELTLYYQPKVDLRTGAVIGFEALLRWIHPERGMVGPGEFIRVAEETGLIVPIGMWTLAEGCRQMQRWCAEHPAACRLALSVNLSPRQFSDPDLCETIRRILDETGFNPRRLNFEITESVLADDLDKARETLERLKAMNISLKLDDFGTGYSSLSYLCRLPFDTLKIDRSFVSGMAESQETAGIVRTIIALANELHMDVIAEGIEKHEEMLTLRDLGCQYGQGFYFGRPLPPNKIVETILTRPNGIVVIPSVTNGHQSYRY